MKNFRIFLIPLFAFSLFFALVYIQIVWATTTDLSLKVDDGTLGVSIVDVNGDPAVTPSVSFGNQSFSFDAQNFNGTLGSSSEKIRLSNPTATPAWNVAFAATGGSSAVWDNSTHTFPYNATSEDNGRLLVNPVAGTITGVGGCSTANISKGTQDYFLTTTTTSIDLMTASGTAEVGCRWDLTGVALQQRIPAAQPPGNNYVLNMTISAT